MQKNNTNTEKENISVIIPSYNGKELLGRNLPHLLKAVRPGDEIIIADDGSVDGSAEFIENNYPGIKLIRLDKNQGFSSACNRGIKESRNRLVYLLNNDVKVKQDFIGPLLGHFQKENTFAVNSREIPPGVETDFDVLTLSEFKFGIFWYHYARVPRLKDAVPVLFANGGHTLIDKEKFISLGGFDKLYSPAYWEDWDISYRARKLGYEVIYEPQSELYHDKKGSFGKILSEKDIRILQWRNHFLFIWKNISSGWLLLEHIFFLPILLALLPLIGKGYFCRAFFQAFRRLPEALDARKKVSSLKYIFTDKEVIKRFSVKSVKGAS
ncbi:MAG: glycosyltransferase family 2 protein [bacterium]